jgi:hypothetical protein
VTQECILLCAEFAGKRGDVLGISTQGQCGGIDLLPSTVAAQVEVDQSEGVAERI